jgi:DNA repair exonuclease SbcCD ATPase subunit
MTQDIRQWLAEIKSLQQKLVEVQQEREQAYGSASNWRNLYETEARQRRAEAEIAEAKIADLQSQLVAQAPPLPSAENYEMALRQQVEQWQTIDQLQSQLLQVLLERDRLAQALQTEQQAHEQTRQDLTTALGDTMELLTKARATHSVAPVANLSSSAPEQPQAKNPSPERPHLHLVQFPS